MPLILEGRVPTRWAESRDSRLAASVEEHAKRSDAISLALINNMPDAALEDTELQFFELLDIASGDAPVYLRLYSLTGVPRTDRGQRHLNNFYFDFDDKKGELVPQFPPDANGKVTQESSQRAVDAVGEYLMSLCGGARQVSSNP